MKSLCVFFFAGFLGISSAQAYDCLIEPHQMVDLGTPVTGLLEQVLVGRADRITKGQPLARLESRAERAASELARFKSELTGPAQLARKKIEFARLKYGRRQVMTRENLMPAQERDDAEAELRLAEAEFKVATENRQIARLEHEQQQGLLALREIQSPFDGVVVEQLAFAGEVVEPGAGKRGILRVEVLPELAGKGPYLATVKSVDRLLNAASGTFVVLLELANPKLEIPAGITCEARFPGAGEKRKSE